MGHLRKATRRDGTSYHEARYRDALGREHSQRFKTKREARLFLDRQSADLQRGAYLDPRLGRVTLAEWTDVYMANALHKRATTTARDRDVLKNHVLPALGARPLAGIKPLDVQRLVQTMADRLAPTTVKTNYGVLRAVLSAAVAAELLAVSPCRGIKLPAGDRRDPRFLSAQQLQALADAMPADYMPMAYLAGVMGLRWSEVVGLRVGRIDFLRRTVAVLDTIAEVEGRLVAAPVKTPASLATLDTPAFVLDVLSEHLARRGRPGPEELVFVSPQGGPVRSANFRSRVWRPALRTAGIEALTFHELRHTAAGLLIELGAHPKVIQQRMRHRSIRTTFDVYGHVLRSVDAKVTADLEGLFRDAPRGARGAPASGHDTAGEPHQP